MLSKYPFHDILMLIREAKRISQELKDSPIGKTAGGPFLDETLAKLEEAAQASMKAGVYSLPKSVIDALPD